MDGKEDDNELLDVPGMRVKNFSISHSFDVYKNGEKAGVFVNMGFELEVPLDPKEAVVAQLRASQYVTASVLYDALARGILTKEQANEMIAESKKRHQGIASALRKSLDLAAGKDQG
jgi:hypothetical protein